MNVLDLFSGLEGWAGAAKALGHDTVTLDLDPRFGADHVRDILTVRSLAELERTGRFDVVFASPPCESFSTGSFRHHWAASATCERCGESVWRVSGERWEHEATDHKPLPRKPYRFTPKSARGGLGLRLLEETVYLIRDYQPRVFIIENPRAMMRNMAVLDAFERRTVTFCQYGDTVMKPTDLWGGFPPNLILKPPCRNGAECHEAAPRGAKTGTQGKKDAAARGKIPFALAEAIIVAADLEATE